MTRQDRIDALKRLADERLTGDGMDLLRGGHEYNRSIMPSMAEEHFDAAEARMLDTIAQFSS